MTNISWSDFMQDRVYGGVYNPSIGVIKPKQTTSSKKTSSKNSDYKTYTVVKKNTAGTTKDDIASVLNNTLAGLTSGYSGGGGGGGVSAQKIDITPMINTLKNQASQQKKTVSDTYKSQRNKLAEQLRVYQENNAKDKQRQIAAFNSARADLEEDAYMNMRAAQQSAAARGLGGSGLQQLSQLSSQIQSGKATSDLSEENTETMNSLIKALNDYSKEVNTAISDATTAERNALNEIDANVANAISDLQYKEEVRYQEALQAAAAANASTRAQANSAANELKLQYAALTSEMSSIMQDAADNGVKAINKIINKRGTYKSGSAYEKALQKAYDKADKQISEAATTAGLGDISTSYKNYYLDQLKSAFNNAGSLIYKKDSGLSGLLGNYSYYGSH